MENPFSKLSKHIIQVLQSTWDASTRLVEMPHPKNIGVEATADIEANQLITYYPIVVVTDSSNKKSTNRSLDPYIIDVQDIHGEKNNIYIGLPDLSQVPISPIGNIARTGIFVNEPYPLEKPNAILRGVPAELRVGLHLYYYVQATCKILKGEEILVCYGDNYDRGEPEHEYKTGCDEQSEVR